MSQIILRKHAHELVQNVVLGFAFSVIAIRFFMAVSPITILVVGNFHVAHMLYGGVLLLIASLLVYILQNSRALEISSWLTGIGFGFFIDEIGKYVSLNNDYYYKLAAPLIYLSFLITVFVFFWVKQRQKLTAKERLYHALFDVQRIMEERLYLFEFPDLKRSLKELLKESDQPLQRALASELHDFVLGKQRSLRLANRGRLFNLQSSFRSRARSIVYRAWFSRVLLLALVVRVLWVIPSIILPLVGLTGDLQWRQARELLTQAGLISGNQEFYPFFFLVVMEVTVGLGLLLALSLIVARKPHGYWLARRLLFFSILFLGLFNVYFGQFSAFISIAIDALLLFLLTKLYKNRD
jgi:hypothetical protein